MKKIICPSDFSAAARNAVIYAAELARHFNIPLEILNIRLTSATQPIASGIGTTDTTHVTEDFLARITAEISESYRIHCTFTLERSVKTLEKAIREKSGKDQLIVMGTNGIDDPYQYIFGTNSFGVIKKVRSPVLLIPEDTGYKPFRRIVFLWDYSQLNKATFSDLQRMTRTYDPEIVLLHVSLHNTAVSDEVFDVLREELRISTDHPEKTSFPRLFTETTENIPALIDDYMNEKKADLLAISYYDRGNLKNIFHQTTIKYVTEVASYPVLVLHQ